MRKNDTIQLEITDIATDGNGVGRCGGMVVFVPYTAPGDIISCKIVKSVRSHVYGILCDIISPSLSRTSNDCPSFPKCGGCALRHISYEAECSVKAGWVAQNMRRIAGTDAELLPIIPAPAPMRYRNKAIYPFSTSAGVPVAGFYAQRSHRVVPHEDCLLHPAVFSQIRRVVTDFIANKGISVYNEQLHQGLVRHLCLRIGEVSGEIMVCLVINGADLPFSDELVSCLTSRFPQVSTIVLNKNTRRTNVALGEHNRTLFGTGVISDVLCGLSFRLSPGSFYQINRAATELLYRRVSELCALSGTETLLDLYCGIGTIGLTLAPFAGRVVGVEVSPAAVENANQNAAQNRINNAHFIASDAAHAASALMLDGIRPDVVVLDPPRKGLAPGLVNSVADMSPKRVVMVSCNSATAARDVAMFKGRGYKAQLVQPLDMFPRSAHVECVVLLTNG